MSGIEVTRCLATLSGGDWTLENIKRRDKIVTSEIIATLNQWDKEYQEHSMESIPAEDQKRIEEYRKKGWL